MSSHLIVKPKSVIKNPDHNDLKKMVGEMPNARLTEYNNYVVETRVVSRSKASTFVVTDDPSQHSDQTITRQKGDEVAKLQDDYIKDQDMLVIEGFIGPEPQTRTPVRLMIEKKNANIAAMQQQLYFTPTSNEFAHFEPELNVIYTPNLAAKGFPNDRLIAVDLQQNITRVFNSDYFGESKKGGLRMWNALVHKKGGLAMHAGCKVIPVGGELKVGLIIGLSGTGKTTTTFTRQNDSRPVQDDFVALFPNGKVVATENGCFAKTYGLDPKSEPMIYGAVTKPQAFMENVSVSKDGKGKVDFFDESYTQNGRATFSFDNVDGVGDLRNINKVDFVLILNRNENVIPGVARLDQQQAAAFFMLGETKGTSAGGAEEAGKALRVPGTNPFFPLLHAQQGQRFLELLRAMPMKVYLMNTGWVGGASGTQHSQKVKIHHSSAVVKAIAEETIEWSRDSDFGYDVASKVPGITGEESHILRPKDYYGSTGRAAEYDTFVKQLKTDRVAHLRKYPGLNDEIIHAVG